MRAFFAHIPLAYARATRARDGPDAPKANRPDGPAVATLRRVTMNVKGEMKGDILTLVIDTSKAAREAAKESKSGKTRLLASTSGFSNFGDVKVSLNATIDK